MNKNQIKLLASLIAGSMSLTSLTIFVINANQDGIYQPIESISLFLIITSALICLMFSWMGEE